MDVTLSTEQLAQMVSPEGAVIAGTPQQVIDKLFAIREALGNERLGGQIDIGGQPFGNVMKSMELYATQVAPAVRRALASPLSSVVTPDTISRTS